jgi:hypothetical protein
VTRLVNLSVVHFQLSLKSVQDFMGKRKKSARKPGGGARQKVPLGEEVGSISYMTLTCRDDDRHHFHLSVLSSRQVGYS